MVTVLIQYLFQPRKPGYLPTPGAAEALGVGKEPGYDVVFVDQFL